MKFLKPNMRASFKEFSLVCDNGSSCEQRSRVGPQWMEEDIVEKLQENRYDLGELGVQHIWRFM